MSIKNEPKIKNGLIVAIREQLEHRALWMYLLCDEAKKKGLNPEDYAPAAIKRCGLYQGANLRKKAGGGESLKGLKKTLFSKAAQWVFEMKIKRCDDDHLDIDFHYCPLVKAWQKQGCSDEEIQMMCDEITNYVNQLKMQSVKNCFVQSEIISFYLRFVTRIQKMMNDQPKCHLISILHS